MALTEQQQVLLGMLRKIAEFMDANGIRYYSLGGTTIGALRHNGFIPWDDDIDLLVDRDNYYKLVEASSRIPYDDLEFICFETDPRWRKPFAQFYSTADTAYLKNVIFNRDKSLGTKIDVMVLDYVPSEHLPEYVKDFILYQEVNIDIKTYNERVRWFKDEYFDLEKRCEQEGRAAVVGELKARLEKYSAEESDKRVVRLWGRKLRDYDASWFEEPQYYDFEGLSMPVPTAPEAALRLQYGYNWYRVPLTRQRVHGFYYNANVPAANYYNDLVQFIDFDEADEWASRRKHISVQRLDDKVALNRGKADIEVQRMLMDLDLDGRAEKLHEAYLQGRYGELIAAMKPVFSHRKPISMVKPEYVQLPSQVLEDWLLLQIERGRCFDAQSMLAALDRDPDERVELRTRARGEEPTGRAVRDWDDTDPLMRTRKLLSGILSLAAAYQDRDCAAMSVELGAFTQEQQDALPDALLARVRMKQMDANADDTWEELDRLLAIYLERFPGNYDPQKTRADVLMELGREQEAMELYRAVHAKSTNGLDILDIEERFGFEPRF